MREDERSDSVRSESFEGFLEGLAPQYHEPPETPREEMWRVVEARLRRNRNRRLMRSRATWGMAAAAVLVLGIGLGRLTAPTATGPVTTPSATVGVVGERDGTFRMAALDHLRRTESFLTLVRSDARSGRVDQDVGGWARGLLTETRLLMDSPAGRDPALESLLEDLELILVQVAHLDGSGAGGRRGEEELEMIAEGMDERDVLTRLQTVLPSGPASVGL